MDYTSEPSPINQYCSSFTVSLNLIYFLVNSSAGPRGHQHDGKFTHWGSSAQLAGADAASAVNAPWTYAARVNGFSVA